MTAGTMFSSIPAWIAYGITSEPLALYEVIGGHYVTVRAPLRWTMTRSEIRCILINSHPKSVFRGELRCILINSHPKNVFRGELF